MSIVSSISGRTSIDEKDVCRRAAESKGWFYPPDPSSKKYCTIGGNIACNAGGMHGGRYGVTRDFVLALKGFLPTGEFVEWGTATKKFSAGFNLRDLWIGSEGMLGIVTDATLKLIPRPEERWTLLVSFRTETDAFRAVLAHLPDNLVEDLVLALAGASSGISLLAIGDPRPLQASQPGPAENAPLLPCVMSLNAEADLVA